MWSSVLSSCCFHSFMMTTKDIMATGDVDLSQTRPGTGHVMHFMDEWQHAVFARILFLLL